MWFSWCKFIRFFKYTDLYFYTIRINMAYYEMKIFNCDSLLFNLILRLPQEKQSFKFTPFLGFFVVASLCNAHGLHRWPENLIWYQGIFHKRIINSFSDTASQHFNNIYTQTFKQKRGSPGKNHIKNLKRKNFDIFDRKIFNVCAVSSPR